MSNLKQVGTAALMYSQDYDDKHLPVSVGINTPNYRTWWGRPLGVAPAYTTYSGIDMGDGLLQPYLKSAQIMKCPSWEAQDATVENGRVGNNFGYAFNGRYLYRGISLSEINRPAETIMVADAARRDAATGKLLNFDLLDPINSNHSIHSRVHGRHNGMGNILFVDGHVKSMKVTPISRNYAESEFTDTAPLVAPIVATTPASPTRQITGSPFNASHFAAFPKENLGDVGTPGNNLYDLN